MREARGSTRERKIRCQARRDLDVARGFEVEVPQRRLVRKASLKVVRWFRPRLGLRGDDVILGAFPKSGSTWLRFIHANIVALLELHGRTVDYHLLNGPLAAEYDPCRFPTIEYECIPRLVKTHKEYSPRRFGKNRCLCLYRNPADTMVSFFEYSRNRRDVDFEGSFGDFLRHRERGLEAWCRHVSAWLAAADARVSYESMKRDALGSVRRAFQEVGIAGVADDVLNEAVERSRFERTQRLEKERGLDLRAREHLKEGARFARKGEVGQWRDYFEERHMRFLEETLERWDLGGMKLPE